MASFNQNQLTINTVAQDRLREWFSKRDGSLKDVKITAFGLGDSDVNYEMSKQHTRIKVADAPYLIPRIKHHLIYDGRTSNLTGKVECYVRVVEDSGIVSSYYSYPTNTNLSQGVTPPKKGNQYDLTDLPVNILNTSKEGYICFFQTLPDGYNDASGNPLRLKEQYVFLAQNLPSSWELIIDDVNGSFFLAKPAGYVFTGDKGEVMVKGKLSSLTKKIYFNI